MVLRDHIKGLGHWLTAPAGMQTKAAPLLLEQKHSLAQAAAFFNKGGIEQYPPRKYRELLSLYRTNPIVRRATKLCAEGVAMIEPVVTVNGKESSKAAEQMAAYLKKPNPKQDWFNFVRDAAAFDKLSGNAWFELVPGMAGYAEQYALRPERMRIVPDARGWVGAYIYDPGNGKRLKWWGDDGRQIEGGTSDSHYSTTIHSARGRILHLKDFAPDDDLFGAGALEAAEGALALYESAQTLARNLFDNGMLMSGILTYDPQVPAGATQPQLTNDQRTLLQKMLDDFRIGKNRAGKTMVAPAALKYVPMSNNLVDLQAEEIRNQASRAIANAFGVPPMLLGIPGDNTYANFTEASRAFCRNTLIPDAKRLLGGLGRWYAQMARVDDLSLDVDEEKMWALSEEISLLWQRVDNAYGLSIDERREAKGYEPLNQPGSNVVLVSPGLVPLDQVLAPPDAMMGDPAEDGGPGAPKPKPGNDKDGDGKLKEGKPDEHAA